MGSPWRRLRRASLVGAPLLTLEESRHEYRPHA